MTSAAPTPPPVTAEPTLRDPRTGEAAADPTVSRADDPTHGVTAHDRVGAPADPATPNAANDATASDGPSTTKLVLGFVAAVVVVIAIFAIVG